jgi:hypothetical protein
MPSGYDPDQAKAYDGRDGGEFPRAAWGVRGGDMEVVGMTDFNGRADRFHDAMRKKKADKK